MTNPRAFPVGTLLGAYIVYTATSRILEELLSAEYRAVIEQTPHVMPRLSTLVWVSALVLIVLELATGGTIVAFIFG